MPKAQQADARVSKSTDDTNDVVKRKRAKAGVRARKIARALQADPTIHVLPLSTLARRAKFIARTRLADLNEKKSDSVRGSKDFSVEEMHYGSDTIKLMRTIVEARLDDHLGRALDLAIYNKRQTVYVRDWQKAEQHMKKPFVTDHLRAVMKEKMV